MAKRKITLTPKADEDLREIVVGPYLIAYYIVSDERIDILAIHHSAKPKR